MTQTTPTKRQVLLANLSLILTAVIWGSGFIGSQMALDANFSSAFIMFGRFAIATAIIGALSFRDIRRNLRREHWKGGVVIGAFLFFAFYVQTVALQYTTPSKNAFITAANVVIVPFLWWIVKKHRPQAKMFLCSAACLVGIGILSLNFAEGFSISPGDALTFLCAILFACQIVATGVLAESIEPKLIVFLQFFVATVLAFLFFLVTDGDFSSFQNGSGMLSVAYLGVFSTCAAYFLQTTAQRYVSSSKAAILLSMESLFGTLFSVLLGYDALTVNMVVGGMIIILSTVATEIKLPSRR